MEHLEGRQSIVAALRARQRRFEVILMRHGLHADAMQEVVELAQSANVPIRQVEGRELDAMAHGASHGGILAICSAKPRTTPRELLELIDQSRAAPLLLLLEGIDDARNLGFTMRSAEALGATAVLIKKHLWDFDAVEVARPSSGAYERLPLVQIDDLEPLQQLQRRGIRLIGCLAGVRTSMYACDLKLPTIIAIGGEKRGLSGAVRSICDGFITIPSIEGSASLSLSAAAAVVLAEAMRQRAK
ncbi:MAG: RNA methyltransferase [Phycisphaerae bacterium]|nr:RNA methyltransferase [Phycisphaerae bacterium]